MLNLRPRRAQFPTKYDLRPLHQVARDLEMPHVGRMIRGREVIMLQDPCRVEIMNIIVAFATEVFIGSFNFGDVGRVLDVSVCIVVFGLEVGFVFVFTWASWRRGSEVAP